GLSGEWVDLTQTCKNLGQKPLCRITGTLRVFNPGTAIAGPSVVRFFLSADTTLDGTDPVLGDEPVGALGSGVEVLVPLDIRLRPGESASGQFVIAVVDADNDVPEANEENNVVVSPPIPLLSEELTRGL
ncbi:MAG: hypothetical protein HYZ72_19190, partial [Deltaproteobacteria bacterium]|nr:hypothetical protein [Deltaproteobacteria bacterium]